MTKEQMDGLRQSFRRFGYLSPIIIDQNNVVADGEHRVEIYKEFGRDTIPAFRVEFADDSERRLLRQVMNKLHGSHDPLKDVDEFQRLLEAGKLGDLASMIAEDEQALRKAIEVNMGIKEPIELEIKETLKKYILSFEFEKMEDYDFVLSTLKDLEEQKEEALISLARYFRHEENMRRLGANEGQH